MSNTKMMASNLSANQGKVVASLSAPYDFTDTSKTG
jgi:hypothetical protein